MLRHMSNDDIDSYDYQYTPTPKKKSNLKDTESVLSERKLAIYGGIFALLIISAKLYDRYIDTVKKVVLEQHLVSYEELTEEGDVMLRYAWSTAVRYSRFWLPALFGFLSSYFTWLMVYLDSRVPGVQPPSPLSPNKYRGESGHTFHLNYVFAISIGVLVFSYTFWKGLSIEF